MRRRKTTLLLHLKSWTLPESCSQRNWNSQNRERERGRGRKSVTRLLQDTIRSGLRIPMIFLQRSLWKMRGKVAPP